MTNADMRSCNVCIFDPFGEPEEDRRPISRNASFTPSPNLDRVREQILHEMQEHQRNFAYYVEKKLSEAMKADSALANMSQKKQEDAVKQKKPKTRELQDLNTSSTTWWQADDDVQIAQKNGYQSMRLSQPEPRELTKMQAQWTEEWLAEVEDGELDVYTCLGLSNCCSWTPDTRKILGKALGVAFLQMAVPFCLLFAELEKGVQFGPARNNVGFRLVGLTLYGYAIYSMYNGADGHCRTNLLNVMFQYDSVPLGNYLPLLIGELSNVFTAIVLIVALYSIFTTQTEPEDLIMNAIAVNFLCDVDGSFVDRDMRNEAVETFKTFTHTLFTMRRARQSDPYSLTGPAYLTKGALYIIMLAGILGCSCFMMYPYHAAGERDTEPGFQRHIETFKEINGTLTAMHD